MTLELYTWGLLIFNVLMLLALLAYRRDYIEYVTAKQNQRCRICKLRRDDHNILGRLAGHKFEVDK